MTQANARYNEEQYINAAQTNNIGSTSGVNFMSIWATPAAWWRRRGRVGWHQQALAWTACSGDLAPGWGISLCEHHYSPFLDCLPRPSILFSPSGGALNIAFLLFLFEFPAVSAGIPKAKTCLAFYRGTAARTLWAATPFSIFPTSFYRLLFAL